jgi:adenine-specific DNA-methyltransferase
VWESLVLWDEPEVYGVACKRVDCRTRGSRFNGRRDARDALAEVIDAVRAPHLVVSFNDEGHLTRAEVEAMLAKRGEVVVFARDFKRYVGAQIGIHDPQGRKVGTVGHLRNTEHIYVASPDPAVVARVRSLGAAAA